MAIDERKGVRRCHWGSKFAFQWKGLKFFGGGSFRGMDTTGMDMIIDCGAGVQQSDGAAAGEQPLIKTIAWPDGGVPDLSENEWKDLLGNSLRLSQDRKKDLNVLVCCVGGHGRTGTALAILSALSGIAPDDPVGFIRMEYCPRAVETKTQCRYIRSITKLDIEDSGLALAEEESCETEMR